MMQAKLVALDLKPGSMPETRSGIQALNPKIYGRFADEGCESSIAFVLIHPTNNFMNHYLIQPLEYRGHAVLALNTRYLGNEAFLIFEQAIKDLGTGIRFLKELGYSRVCLIGNSGGAALAAFYQSQAENPNLTTFADGRPFEIDSSELPPADLIALVAAHAGRAKTLTSRLDAAVMDERDLFSVDPALDVFDPANGPPFSSDFVARVRAAQLARNRRITDWCLGRLRQFERLGNRIPVNDQTFVVHRTMADPRFLDLNLEPNGRQGGTALESDTMAANYAVNGTAALCSLRSWLSQWSYDYSRADGPACLTRTSTPTLIVNYEADEIVYPTDKRAYENAAAGRAEVHDIPNAGHYPQSNPGTVESVADLISDWAQRAAR